MKALIRSVIGLAREIAGLFFDDGSLALSVLVILGATAILMHAAWFEPSAAMTFLVSGVIAALLENVARTARADVVSSETQPPPAETSPVPRERVMRFPHR
jgi:hypothetical protein